MGRDWYDYLYERDINPLVKSEGTDYISLQKFKVFDYLVRVDVAEYLANMQEGEVIGEEEKTNEEYIALYEKIITAIDESYINPFNWEDYNDVYYGYFDLD